MARKILGLANMRTKNHAVARKDELFGVNRGAKPTPTFLESRLLAYPHFLLVLCTPAREFYTVGRAANVVGRICVSVLGPAHRFSVLQRQPTPFLRRETNPVGV